jgi:hypothetical protein
MRELRSTGNEDQRSVSQVGRVERRGSGLYWQTPWPDCRNPRRRSASGVWGTLRSGRGGCRSLSIGRTSVTAAASQTDGGSGVKSGTREAPSSLLWVFTRGAAESEPAAGLAAYPQTPHPRAVSPPGATAGLSSSVGRSNTYMSARKGRPCKRICHCEPTGRLRHVTFCCSRRGWTKKNRRWGKHCWTSQQWHPRVRVRATQRGGSISSFPRS